MVTIWATRDSRVMAGSDVDKYSIYVHALPGFELKVDNASVFYKRQVVSQCEKKPAISRRYRSSVTHTKAAWTQPPGSSSLLPEPAQVSHPKNISPKALRAECGPLGLLSQLASRPGNRDESLDEESSDERKDSFLDFVVYQTELKEEEELTGYDLDKKIGRPHAFIESKAKKPIEEPLTSEELWWNWRKPDREQWSRFFSKLWLRLGK
ncbi:hypothetical protein PHJA_002149500 [Phtheirospermum japonicum]|uniref:Uncharacterized protein n=1 Tax=Phtheirospermum japonicum TaxID=374723 RepID=A0A830CV19_9LAMI|nr:hypothetical protein PHJA_002149500 [Phtheirospermum japonicum]